MKSKEGIFNKKSNTLKEIYAKENNGKVMCLIFASHVFFVL